MIQMLGMKLQLIAAHWLNGLRDEFGLKDLDIGSISDLALGLLEHLILQTSVKPCQVYVRAPLLDVLVSIEKLGKLVREVWHVFRSSDTHQSLCDILASFIPEKFICVVPEHDYP